MPVLQKLQREFSRQGFEVLGVNYKEGPARIDAFINKHSIRFPVVRDDDGATAKAWGAQVFPASFLIDRAGRRRYFCVGDADWTSLKMMNTIRALIAEPKQ
jgi:peroxiredoxin